MNGQLAIPRARHSDPDTAHQAAASVKNLSETHRYILEMFEIYRAMTDYRLQRIYDLRTWTNPPRISASGIRTRRKELVDMGKLEDSGKRETLPSGRKAIVWGLAK